MQRYSINLFVDSSNRLLLLKRSNGSEFAPGLWGFCGGKIESHETPFQCSRREAKEELGLELQDLPSKQIGPVRDTWHGGAMRVWLFAYLWPGGEIILNKEHTRYAWVGVGDYSAYDVVKGVDEDIAWLCLWPRKVLNQALLPPNLRQGGQDA